MDRYAEHLRSDTGAQVRVFDSGMGSLGGAEVVTFNIGINDLGQASRAYENGICGGTINEERLRAAVEEVEENWDAVIEEVLRLCSTQETILRTAAGAGGEGCSGSASAGGGTRSP